MPGFDAELGAQTIRNLPQPCAAHLADILWCVNLIELTLFISVERRAKRGIGPEPGDGLARQIDGDCPGGEFFRDRVRA